MQAMKFFTKILTLDFNIRIYDSNVLPLSSKLYKGLFSFKLHSFTVQSMEDVKNRWEKSIVP